MADGPDKKSFTDNDLMNMLMGQYQANQPTGPLSQVNPLWLGAAQGFLSPTKTGSFAESMGSAASGVESPLQAMRKSQMDALEKIANIQNARDRLAMEAPLYQSRANWFDERVAGGGLDPIMRSLHLKSIVSGLKKQFDDETDPNKKEQIRLNLEIANEQLRQSLGAQQYQPPAAPQQQPDTGWSWYNPFSWGSGSSTPAQAPSAQPAQPAPVAPQQTAAPKQTAAPAQKGAKAPTPLPPAQKQRALDAIAKGADPVAVMKMITDGGYSTEGLQ